MENGDEDGGGRWRWRTGMRMENRGEDGGEDGG